MRVSRSLQHGGAMDRVLPAERRPNAPAGFVEAGTANGAVASDVNGCREALCCSDWLEASSLHAALIRGASKLLTKEMLWGRKKYERACDIVGHSLYDTKDVHWRSCVNEMPSQIHKHLIASTRSL